MPLTHSEELGELATALSAAQGEFESVAKNAANPFFKSKYAALPDVVKAATPILAANGLSVTQLPGVDEHGHTLTTMVLHKSGQYIAETMRLRPVKDDPQAQGSAITYGRRYSYMAALGLVADEDDDGNAASAARKPAQKAKPKQAPKATPQAATEPTDGTSLRLGSPLPAERVSELRGLVTQAGWDAETLTWALLSVGVDDASNLKAAIPALTTEQAGELEKALTTAIAESAS